MIDHLVVHTVRVGDGETLEASAYMDHGVGPRVQARSTGGGRAVRINMHKDHAEAFAHAILAAVDDIEWDRSVE